MYYHRLWVHRYGQLCVDLQEVLENGLVPQCLREVQARVTFLKGRNKNSSRVFHTYHCYIETSLVPRRWPAPGYEATQKHDIKCIPIDCKDYVTGIGNGSCALIASRTFRVETLLVVTSAPVFCVSAQARKKKHHKTPLHYTQVTVEGQSTA